MVSAYLSKDIVLAIGPAANNLTTVSGSNGLADVAAPRSYATRVKPSQGDNVERQSLQRADNAFNFTIDANSVSWPLLYGKGGSELFYEFGPQGGAAGAPKETGKAIINVVHNMRI